MTGEVDDKGNSIGRPRYTTRLRKRVEVGNEYRQSRQPGQHRPYGPSPDQQANEADGQHHQTQHAQHCGTQPYFGGVPGPGHPAHLLRPRLASGNSLGYKPRLRLSYCLA